MKYVVNVTYDAGTGKKAKHKKAGVLNFIKEDDSEDIVCYYCMSLVLRKHIERHAIYHFHDILARAGVYLKHPGTSVREVDDEED